MNTPNQISSNALSEAERAPVPMPEEDTTPSPIQRAGNFNRAKDWLKDHKLSVALGMAAVSTTVTVTSESFEQTKEQVIEVAPWVGGGLLAMEAGWIGGAAIMMASVGDKVGNPIKIRSRMPEIAKKAKDSLLFKSGFALNYASAVGQAALVGGAIVKELPPQAWGVAGIAALDLSATIAVRQAIWGSIKENSAKAAVHELVHGAEPIGLGNFKEAGVKSAEKEKTIRPKIRKASFNDVGRLAEIDLARYKRVYGKEMPTQQEVQEMFTRRLANATPDWMYVCEVDGVVEGFATGCRTNKPIEEFISWEDSTADGTLENCVEPEGQYVYAANLTVNPRATELGGENMLMGYLIAQAIEEGIEYGYFISRMPLFSAWIKRQVKNGVVDSKSLSSPDVLDDLANQYVNYKKEVNGKPVRVDYQLRLYEESGFEMGKIVHDAFEDPQSLNYGVLFKVPVPPSREKLKKAAIIRKSMATALRRLSDRPKLLEKVL